MWKVYIAEGEEGINDRVLSLSMALQKKKLVILGATGSIGTSTLHVLRTHPEAFELVGIAAYSKAEKLRQIADEFAVPHVCLINEQAGHAAAKENTFAGPSLYVGAEGLTQLATLPEADLVLVATVGTVSLHPTLEAIRAGKNIAIANKEILVMAGAFVTAEAKKHKVSLLPTDSEHNAIFQCLQGDPPAHLEKIILTASGGAFRDLPLDQFIDVTPEQALRHPNWDMGPKVTIDSATMANKGLEIIEARWLFDLRPEQIEVTIHPQSIVHSLVQFIDGSILAQLSPPSMTFAIQHCLFFPERATPPEPTLNFAETFSLDFRPPQMERYPCLRLAMESLRLGGVAPAIFNAANEVAVQYFVERRIDFLDIARMIENSLERFSSLESNTLADILQADQACRTWLRR